MTITDKRIFALLLTVFPGFSAVAQDASPSALVDQCGGVRMTVSLSADAPLTQAQAQEAAAVLTERLPGPRLFGRNLVAEVEVVSQTRLLLHRAGSETFGISTDDLFARGETMAIYRVVAQSDVAEAGEGQLSFPSPDGYGGYMFVEAEPAIPVLGVRDVAAIFDQNNRPAISIELTDDASDAFCRLTTDNIGAPLGVVMGPTMLTAPVVQSPICEGSVMVSGSFMLQEVEDLVTELRAGLFQYDYEIIEETIVGPQNAGAAGCAVTTAVGD